MDTEEYGNERALAYDVEKWENMVKSGNVLPGMPDEVKEDSFLVTGCLAEGPRI